MLVYTNTVTIKGNLPNPEQKSPDWLPGWVTKPGLLETFWLIWERSGERRGEHPCIATERPSRGDFALVRDLPRAGIRTPNKMEIVIPREQSDRRIWGGVTPTTPDPSLCSG